MQTGIKSIACAAMIALGLNLPSQIAFGAPDANALVRQQAVDYEKHFASQDAAAIAAMWNPQGTYSDADGNVSVGREQLQKLFEGYFKSNKTPQGMKIQIDSLDQPDPNTVVEHGVAVLTDQRGTALSQSKYIAIHRSNNGNWLLDQLIEFPSEATKQSLSDLNWMMGTWKTGNADAMKLSNRLSGSGKFMISEFGSSDKTSNGPDLMITAVNPSDGRLSSWIFDGSGGYGSGVWSLNDGRWYLTSNRTEPDGTQVALTHVLSKDGDNSFKWQSVSRTVNGIKLKDTQPVQVTRISTEVR